MTLVSSTPYPLFVFSEDSCRAVQERIASDFTAQITAMGLMPMVDNFTVDSNLCGPETVRICGSFFSAEVAKQLEQWANLQATFWLRSLIGDCNAIDAGFTFRMISDTAECMNLGAAWTCSPDTVTFPPCQ
jgi:hypothetical protein